MDIAGRGREHDNDLVVLLQLLLLVVLSVGVGSGQPCNRGKLVRFGPVKASVDGALVSTTTNRKSALWLENLRVSLGMIMIMVVLLCFAGLGR